MAQKIKVASKIIGLGQPTFLIAEIGINHNGSVAMAKKLIDLAAKAGFDAVKFQKRTPNICVPESQKNIPRETPWGTMTYLEYRKRMEFEEKQYAKIDDYCKERKIIWLASAWDIASVDFLERFDIPAYKIPSAMLTNDALIKRVSRTKKPVFLSTGMSSLSEIDHAVALLQKSRTVILQCTSTYPATMTEINLAGINTLRDRYGCVTGYSGHETGITPSIIAVAAFKASVVERHITLNRTLWGSDHSASLEPRGMELLVRDIRNIPVMIGDGRKVVYSSELPIKKKLRLS